MGRRINVLDHGFVRLVSYMQPAPDYHELENPEFGGTGEDLLIAAHKKWKGDLEIVRNARVSFDADWRGGEDEGSDDRLVRRLHARGHTTPFEAMVFTFEVQAPIFVFRQWHRHRTWSYNELSARYAPLNEVYYVPKAEHVGAQGKKEKQVRDMTENVKDTHEVFVQRLGEKSTVQYGEYKLALANEIPRELARLMLPLNMYSRMFATVDLHNLFHFLRLRMDKHAQYEIRVYAEALLDLIGDVVPIAAEAFKSEIPDEGTPFNPIRLTVEERDAVLSSVGMDVEVNADDDLDEDDAKHYALLKSALEKLK